MDERTFLFGVDELQRGYPGQEYSPADRRNLKKQIYQYYHPKAEEWKECIDDLIGSENFLPRVAKVKETFAAIRKRKAKPLLKEACKYCGNNTTALGWVRHIGLVDEWGMARKPGTLEAFIEDNPGRDRNSIMIPCVCGNAPKYARHLRNWRILQKAGLVKLEHLQNDVTHKRLSEIG